MEFVNEESVKKIIKDLYPNATKVNFINHGYDNIVVLVDEQYAVRFPRDETAYARALFEKKILNGLEDLKEIIIPKIISEGINPPYIVTNFIRGQHPTAEDINAMSVEDQKRIGEKIGTFVYEMHSLLSMPVVTKFREEYKLDELEGTWSERVKKTLDQTTFPTAQQDKLAKKYFNLWNEKANKAPTVVVHDDLHTENMLFEEKELIGILDFGDTDIGTPEQDFRQLYRINTTVLDSAIEVYEKLSGVKVDTETSKIWAIVQELAVHSEKLLIKDTLHPAYLRTVKNLQKWLPEGNWGI